MNTPYDALPQKSCLYLFLFFCFSFFSFTEDPAILISDSLYRKADYRQAISVLQNRLSIAQKNKENIIKIVLYNSLGKAYSQLGESVEALKNYQLAIKMTEITGDKQRTGKILKNIGALYEEQKNFTQALSYYDKAQDIAIAIKDQALLADCYNNRGVIYEQQLKYDDALAVYKKALAIYQKLNITDRIALSLNNIGIVYKFQKKFPQSLDYYNRSLKSSEKLGDRFFVAANLNNMGNVYALMNNYPKAVEFNQRALKIAEEIKATNIVVEAYGSLAEDYAGMGDLKKAYELKNKFIAVKEDYINLERSGQMAEMQTRYETEKKENQIVTLQQQQQISSLNIAKQQLLLQKRNYQVFTITGIAISLLIFGYLYNNRQRARQQLDKLKAISDTEKQERTRIAKDIHDDMGSGLSKIILMSGMVEDKIKTSEYGIKEISTIKQISQELVDNMRDLIWVLNPENATLDNLVARIREHCSDYLEGLAVKTELDIQHDVPYVRISQQTQRNIFLTTKEALHNCVKHANCDKITIGLTFKDGMLTVSITDSGKGFEADELKRKGNGLRNMQQRMQSIGGKFMITSGLGQGTTIQTSIQLA
ncbi:tetratricopeptide repeat protein [Mucilaginibacter calamicampi]|uniref:Tetratricopeptide repeat protein n=1 Tax=Mucilaginibacter calamicampi TaxID=1302352 RepID=A0ABW2YTX7_9SPHI